MALTRAVGAEENVRKREATEHPVIPLCAFAVLPVQQFRGHHWDSCKQLLGPVTCITPTPRIGNLGMDEAGDCSLPQTSTPLQEDYALPNPATLHQAGSSLHLGSKITKGLISLGSTILSDYTDPATDYDPFIPKRRPTHEHVESKAEEGSIVSAVAKLNKAAQRAFGAVGDFLKYDYSEEFGPLRKFTCRKRLGSSFQQFFEGKRCILEITRSDGSKRVYSTKHDFARKSEAKTKAASIAIDHGAIDFIMYGDEPRNKGFTLAPVNTPLHAIEDAAPSSDVANASPEEINNAPCAVIADGGSVPSQESTGAVAEIEKCCQEWRAGRIKPLYYFTSDTKSSGKIAFQIHRSII